MHVQLEGVSDRQKSLLLAVSGYTYPTFSAWTKRYEEFRCAGKSMHSSTRWVGDRTRSLFHASDCARSGTGCRVHHTTQPEVMHEVYGARVDLLMRTDDANIHQQEKVALTPAQLQPLYSSPIARAAYLSPDAVPSAAAEIRAMTRKACMLRVLRLTSALA